MIAVLCIRREGNRSGVWSARSLAHSPFLVRVATALVSVDYSPLGHRGHLHRGTLLGHRKNAQFFEDYTTLNHEQVDRDCVKHTASDKLSC
jgi:hypothetical protein